MMPRGKLLSDNFYWRALPDHPDNLQALESLPVVTLEAKWRAMMRGGKCLLDVKLRNPSSQIALMTHLQLRRQNSSERVLPVYYSDNYVSLVPGESRTISIEAAASDLKDQTPLIVVDGWNIAIKPTASTEADGGFERRGPGESFAELLDYPFRSSNCPHLPAICHASLAPGCHRMPPRPESHSSPAQSHIAWWPCPNNEVLSPAPECPRAPLA